MNRFDLLDWLVEQERKQGHVLPTGGGVLTDLGREGYDWQQVATAAGQLLDQGLATARWMARPGATREPRPQALTVYELQEYVDIQVTEKGYAMQNERNPQQAGPTFNISNSQVGQLAAGDIHNITIENLLMGIQQAIDGVNGSAEEKQEARETLGRMREILSSVGTSAAAGVLSAAARAALGLP